MEDDLFSSKLGMLGGISGTAASTGIPQSPTSSSGLGMDRMYGGMPGLSDALRSQFGLKPAAAPTKPTIEVTEGPYGIPAKQASMNPPIPGVPKPTSPGLSQPPAPTYDPFHVQGGTFMPQGSTQQAKAMGKEEDRMRQGGFR